MSETPLEITCSELREKLTAEEPIELIDCRETFEQEIVKLAGARLLPMGEIPARLSEFADLEGAIVVYCHYGMRSAQTAQWLRANGIPDAQSLAGGIDAWAESIDPSLARY